MMTHLITSYLVPIGNILPAFSMIVCIGIAKEKKKITSFSMRWYHYLLPAAANRMRPPLGCGLSLLILIFIMLASLDLIDRLETVSMTVSPFKTLQQILTGSSLKSKPCPKSIRVKSR